MVTGEGEAMAVEWLDTTCPECGTRFEVDHILELPLWEGDRFFLPLVFARDGRQFHGVMPYRDGRPVSWTYSLL